MLFDEHQLFPKLTSFVHFLPLRPPLSLKQFEAACLYTIQHRGLSHHKVKTSSKALTHPPIIETAHLDPIFCIRVPNYTIDVGNIASRRILVIGLQRSRQPLNLGSPRIVRPRQTCNPPRHQNLNTHQTEIHPKKKRKKKTQTFESEKYSQEATENPGIDTAHTNDEEHLGAAVAVSPVENLNSVAGLRPLDPLLVFAHVAKRHPGQIKIPRSCSLVPPNESKKKKIPLFVQRTKIFFGSLFPLFEKPKKKKNRKKGEEANRSSCPGIGFDFDFGHNHHFKGWKRGLGRREDTWTDIFGPPRHVRPSVVAARTSPSR
ncbi:hypothetical protein Taro_022487 [Colocasia esculenta]|uniref:Uncharacterized protein n=1 Tax=Colocasia esculenta TaxID=4460 RepID=A0A843V1P4_COLES|nr:hypothetical protein [Colocasia esculenta]